MKTILSTIYKFRLLISGLVIFAALLIGAFYFFYPQDEYKWLTYDENGNEIEISEEEYYNRFLKKQDDKKKNNEIRRKAGFEKKTSSISSEKYISDLNKHLSMPSENDFDELPVNNWVFKGPYGALLIGSSYRYCGRIRDLEIDGVPSLRVAGATGGLFKTVLFIPVPMSDNDVTTMNMGAFATHPTDTSRILLGTGEPPSFPGTGMWRTTNGGINWLQVSSIPQSGYFHEIKYYPGNPNIVLASHSTGFYRSTDGGVSWTLKLSPLTGYVMQTFDNVAANPSLVYVSRQFDGIWKSTDGGQNFSKVTSFPLTGNNFWSGSMAIASTNTNIVYVSCTNNSQTTSGVYKTTNGGINWISIPGGNMHTLGERNNCIAVSPVNENLLLVGGLKLYRSTNGGANYAVVPNVHDDQCVIKWRPNGTDVYIGNDGGVANSTDGGASFSTSPAIFPVLQALSIDAAAYSGGFIFQTGTQDNGIIATTNDGTSWRNVALGDGGRVTIDRNTPANWMCQLNSGYPIPHSYYYSTNSGGNWTNQTVNPNVWGTTVANDLTAPVYYYCNEGNKVYYKTSITGSWIQLGGDFPENPVGTISVGKYAAGYAPVYALLQNNTSRIKVWDGSNWVIRNSGLPTAVMGDVIVHPANNMIAAAYTTGTMPGQKIYKTTNRGVSWFNITGNFPDLTIKSLALHSTNANVMFASVQHYGVYKTTNGGTTWFRWMNGLPQTLWVEALSYIDSTASNGRFYIAAATHGRGIYVRESGGDDPLTGNNNNNTNLPKQYLLEQNYPNPFNPSTTIKFDLPVSDIVSIEVFDITGRLVQEIIKSKLYPAGSHSITFNGSGISSGAYFYRITTPKFTDVKKMILVK
jgi:hypothetical protein